MITENAGKDIAWLLNKCDISALKRPSEDKQDAFVFGVAYRMLQGESEGSARDNAFVEHVLGIIDK